MSPESEPERVQYQDPEPEAAKLNSAINNCIIYTCDVPAVICKIASVIGYLINRESVTVLIICYLLSGQSFICAKNCFVFVVQAE